MEIKCKFKGWFKENDFSNMKILVFVLKNLLNSPLYPHWLWNLKMKQGNVRILTNIHGNVMEVGAGDGKRKKELTDEHVGIKNYVATDYNTWDSEFETTNKRASKFNGVGKLLWGFENRINLDQVCSATDLPFENDTFDYHISFETLEHIDDPFKYFSESSRVVKKSGHILLSVPFLFRMHGGEPTHNKDFFRYCHGFFYRIAELNNLEVKEIFSNTGLGTTMSALINQWVIRRIQESGLLIGRIICILFAPLVFLITNIAGYMVDLKPDKRFATRFHVIFERK